MEINTICTALFNASFQVVPISYTCKNLGWGWGDGCILIILSWWVNVYCAWAILSLKELEFSFKNSRPLKCLKTGKVLENAWKILEFHRQVLNIGLANNTSSTVAAVQAFLSMAKPLQPFLVKYQTDALLVLYKYLIDSDIGCNGLEKRLGCYLNVRSHSETRVKCSSKNLYGIWKMDHWIT